MQKPSNLLAHVSMETINQTEFKRNLILVLVGIIFLAVLVPFVNHSSIQQETKQETKLEESSVPKTATSPQILFVPKINIWAPIVYVDSPNELDIQTALLRGVVHYSQTSIPGEQGNAYILGLASNYSWLNGSYNTVFADLSNLTIGDNITVIDYMGQTNFKVFATYIAKPDNALNIAQDKNRRLITLQQAYPIGSSEKRFTAVAERD